MLSAAPDVSLEDQRLARWRDSLDRELGPTIRAALANDDVVEILLNDDGELWLDHARTGLVSAGERLSADQAQNLVTTIAGLCDATLTESTPILEAVLPLGDSRIEILVPPLCAAPIFAIRKRAKRIYGLSEYVAAGVLSAAHAQILRHAIDRRLNIIVSGGPGSGKTTLANALLAEMVDRAAVGERFIVLEDTYELQCAAPNCLTLRTNEAVPLRRLVQASLRLRPDRLIVGEVRGPEALDLLKAWNTGRAGGISTLHANSAELALERLDQLVQEAGVPAQRALIGTTVHLVVHIEGTTGPTRRIRELAHIEGFDRSSGAFRVRTDQREDSAS